MKIKGEGEYEFDEELEKDWVMDIDQNEFPVSIFCGHVQKGAFLSALLIQVLHKLVGNVQ